MNKNISSIHLDILDKDRQEILQKILPFTEGFILGGGTALALQLNHRKSFDFDFFSSTPIPKELLEKISRSIKIANVTVDMTGELTFFAEKEIKITFLHYPFESAFPVLELENGLRAFSVPGIAVQKAYTVGRRGEYRDYFDLYTILKNNYISLPELILQTKKVYGNIFEEKLFLQQLVYFDDLLQFDIIPSSPEESVPTPDHVKSFFEELVKEYI